MTEQEYIQKCVIDITSRKVNMYSNLGTEKQVTCDSVNEFMNVIKFIRENLSENQINYSEI